MGWSIKYIPISVQVQLWVSNCVYSYSGQVLGEPWTRPIFPIPLQVVGWEENLSDCLIDKAPRGYFKAENDYQSWIQGMVLTRPHSDSLSFYTCNHLIYPSIHPSMHARIQELNAQTYTQGREMVMKCLHRHMPFFLLLLSLYLRCATAAETFADASLVGAVNNSCMSMAFHQFYADRTHRPQTPITSCNSQSSLERAASSGMNMIWVSQINDE